MWPKKSKEKPEERQHFLAADAGAMLNPGSFYYEFGNGVIRTPEYESLKVYHGIRYNHKYDESVDPITGRPAKQYRSFPKLVLSGRKTTKVSFCRSSFMTTKHVYVNKETGEELTDADLCNWQRENRRHMEIESKTVELPEEDWETRILPGNIAGQTFDELYGPLKILV